MRGTVAKRIRRAVYRDGSRRLMARLVAVKSNPTTARHQPGSYRSAYFMLKALYKEIMRGRYDRGNPPTHTESRKLNSPARATRLGNIRNLLRVASTWELGAKLPARQSEAVQRGSDILYQPKDEHNHESDVRRGDKGLRYGKDGQRKSPEKGMGRAQRNQKTGLAGFIARTMRGLRRLFPGHGHGI